MDIPNILKKGNKTALISLLSSLLFLAILFYLMKTDPISGWLFLVPFLFQSVFALMGYLYAENRIVKISSTVLCILFSVLYLYLLVCFIGVILTFGNF